MKWLDALERRFGFLAVPNITWVIVVGQLLVYFLQYGRRDVVEWLDLVPALVMQGEVWRVATFVFVVGPQNPLFFFIGLLFFWSIGTSVEQAWGAFRYNVFLLIGWAATVGAAFVAPYESATPMFLGASVLLAFATLFPDYTIMFMFFLPLQMRWMEVMAWAWLAWEFFSGDTMVRLLIGAALLNYFVFFTPLIVAKMRGGAKQVARKREAGKGRQPFHRCAVCGKTDVSNPEMDFRYCPECEGGLGYCPDHIANHPHVKAAAGRR